MRKALIGTTALLASVSFAAAQMAPSGGADEKQQPGLTGQSSPGSAEDRNPAASGRDQQRPGKDAQRAQQDQQRGTASQNQSQRDSSSPGREAQPQQGQTQGDRSAAETPRQNQQGAQDNRRQQSPQRSQDGQGQSDQQRATSQPSDAQGDGQASGGQSSGQAGIQTNAQGQVTLNTEQRNEIRKTVMTKADVPRVANVDFSVRVGTAVPSHVTIVDVPPALIEINPRWRSYKYFVVEEEIIVVTPQRRIVAVIPLGSDHARSSNALLVDLSPDEIRIVQGVLARRGFSIEVDGVFGPSTREALMTFQRREGIEATGQINVSTAAALGVRDRISLPDETGSRSSSGMAKSGPDAKPERQGERPR